MACTNFGHRAGNCICCMLMGPSGGSCTVVMLNKWKTMATSGSEAAKAKVGTLKSCSWCCHWASSATWCYFLISWAMMYEFTWVTLQLCSHIYNRYQLVLNCNWSCFVGWAGHSWVSTLSQPSSTVELAGTYLCVTREHIYELGHCARVIPLHTIWLHCCSLLYRCRMAFTSQIRMCFRGARLKTSYQYTHVSICMQSLCPVVPPH